MSRIELRIDLREGEQNSDEDFVMIRDLEELLTDIGWAYGSLGEAFMGDKRSVFRFDLEPESREAAETEILAAVHRHVPERFQAMIRFERTRSWGRRRVI